jgi:hypothetical protein
MFFKDVFVRKQLDLPSRMKNTHGKGGGLPGRVWFMDKKVASYSNSNFKLGGYRYQ